MDELHRRRVRLVASYGIQNAQAIVEAHASSPNMPALSQCLAMIEKESGGANVFGHDPWNPSAYPQGLACPVSWNGGPVTWARYAWYKLWRNRGRQPQGVGPCQLTGETLQKEAEHAGGCWKPRHNCGVGFNFLHQLMLQHGTEGGFAAYNGSGEAAEEYGRSAMEWARIWHDRLKGLAG